MAGFKRKVFYLGGFDPRGVRFYRDLLAEQLERWATHTGDEVTLSARRRASPLRHDWTIRNETRDVTTEYSFLRWEDIVSAAWIRSPTTLAVRAARYYYGLYRFMDLPKARSLGRGQLVTLFYPPVFAVGIPLLIALLALGIAAVFVPWWAALLIGIAAAALIAPPILARLQGAWLLRFFVFNGELGEAGPTRDAIEERLRLFADEILATDWTAWDELVLATHSNGSILAVTLMDRLCERLGGAMPENFTLLTMGHCVPLLACRRDTTLFRRDLRQLASHDFRWVDIGSPPDGAAYHDVNPMLLVTDEARPRVELLNPRFYFFLEPQNLRRGYASKYEAHFDYLRTLDRVSPIDFPSLLAGDRPIEGSIAAFKAML